MAGGILYLDVDDEITSAAARIRSAEGRRVALVLPYGSRVATSRINFRLLARDALTHEKRLSIVAADASTRALAASAGLPVFASVTEYEGSEEAPRPAAGTGTEPRPGIDGDTPTPSKRRRRAAAGAAATTAATTAAGDAEASLGGPADAAGPEQVTMGLAASETVVPPRPRADGGADTGAPVIERPAPPVGRDPVADVRPAGEVRVRARPASSGRGGGSRRVPLLAGLAMLGLAVVVVGVAAFLVLPSATATVTPREETIGPIAFQVTASTSVNEPDVENGVVPAQQIEVPVQAANTFAATGKRTEEEKATGTVRFSNLDPTSTNTIAKGAVVSTESGRKFRTNQVLTVPRARLVGLQIVPSRASVKVTAVDAGPEGNVEPNTITAVPRGEEPLFLKVTNPEAMTGGTREEFPRVTQEDVDAAVAALGTALSTSFADAVDDADLSGGDATVFPETAILGLPTYSVEPTSLVGGEVESFDLGASAVGTVVAVDAGPVDDIAETRLTGSVEAGNELVPDSTVVTVDPAVVAGGTITFPVTVTASQVAILDPAAIEAQILGLPIAEAQGVLDSYGTGVLDVWPDWVGTVPSLDSRVEVTVNGPVPGDEGTP